MSNAKVAVSDKNFVGNDQICIYESRGNLFGVFSIDDRSKLAIRRRKLASYGCRKLGENGRKGCLLIVSQRGLGCERSLSSISNPADSYRAKLATRMIF